jgi:uridine kinase
VIRASIDGFHNPASIRHQRGTTSPEGYYYDSFNYQALKDLLLIPLGPNGTLKYCSAVFDYRADSAFEAEPVSANSNAILLFDGVFLLRPELMNYWDLSIFVDAAFDVTLARAMQRDVALFGNSENVRTRYEQRYIPGQKIYLEHCKPKQNATIVVNNDLDTEQSS